MTFSEFLVANGDETLVRYMQALETIEPIPEAFFNPLYRNSRKTIDFNRWIQSLEPSRLSRVLNKTLPWLKFY